MNKILVCLTGGTIGSQKHNRTLQVRPNQPQLLLESYRQRTTSTLPSVQFDVMQPFNLLSENMTPDLWLSLAKSLKMKDLTQYSGVIITHGSDTLAYTAAAMSYLFRGCQLPIVCIASQYPLDDERSTGLSNFINAVNMICHDPIYGVTVLYEDHQGRSPLHLGTRVLQAEHFTDEIRSAYNVPLGYMENGRLQLFEHPANPDMHQLRTLTPLSLEMATFSREIVHLKPYPGLNYDFLHFEKKKPLAIYHDVYHSGTAYAKTGNGYSFIEFMKRCHADGIDVYIGPIKNLQGDLYASTVTLIEAGAIPLENITVEAAVVKLMLAYGSFKHPEDIARFLQQNVFFEHIPCYPNKSEDK